ncbi:MAG: DUF3857 domain-containing protein [Polyangiaceae bacterium]|nr:DUF3857 domain-containing protein [Polyangiaceae bacterium]
MFDASGWVRHRGRSGALALRYLWIAAVVMVAATTTFARAQPGPLHPDLVEAARKLDRAHGAERYAALREVWGTWDRADPLAVEETLRAASSDPRLGAAERVYAATLSAYGRLRRGDPGATRREIARLGFVDQWLVVGPFDNEGKAGFDADQGPEGEIASAIVPGRAYGGKERAVRWRAVPAGAFPFGWLDSGALVRPTQRICVVAKTFVLGTGTRPRPVNAWVGASGALKLYFNGQLVLEDGNYRGHDTDRFAAELRLHPGPNDLTAKLCGEDEPPILSLRLADRRGAPDPTLRTTNDLGSTVAAAALAARIGDQPYRRPPGSVVGPLFLLRERANRPGATAADLEAYARYLVATSSDDPTDHVARDIARRAAELDPTVERLLLAGELAEDRNQWAAWLTKAVSATADHPRVDVLLAQGAHARGGIDGRQAFPFYDQVLAIDPDNAHAIAGRVELYAEAGLERTALETLERALGRNPSALNLLNLHASALRALGRIREATEAETRYSTLRFDDRGYLASEVSRALARRDDIAAARWIERLLAVAPDSQWALGFAARTRRALGQAEEAIATFERALDLCPEDVETLRSLADLHGELGNREQQLATLRRILDVMPQDRAVREYVEHLEPTRPRADERYAWEPKRFLELRGGKAAGQNRRILRDLTVTTVHANGKGSRFRQIVFQPLTDAAAAAGRQYSFQYQADREVVQLRGARVYRTDGRVDAAVESGEGAANRPEISMYTSARTFYVQMPRLEPGDVVELKYRVDDVTPRNEFADYFGEVVYLQSNEPVANAEYVLVTPATRRFHFDTNLSSLEHTQKRAGAAIIHRFFARKIPPVAEEPMMPPLPEIVGHVHVSTYASFQDMGAWYWGLSKDQLELDDETRQLARTLGDGARTEREKVERVYDWVVKNTRYVGLELGIYGYKPRPAVQTVARGWGDCKDKATVIVALLRELGIGATVVVVRTQLRGDFSSKVASLAPFDHAVAYVPSLDLYLDGTAEYAGADELPLMDYEALGLLVNEGHPKLVRLPANDPVKHAIVRRIQARLAIDGDAELEARFEARGSAAPAWRQSFHAKSTLRERIQSELLGPEYPGFMVADGPTAVATAELEDFTRPVWLTVRGHAPAFARREGTDLSVQVTPGTRLTPSYASLSRRTQDVRILALPGIHNTMVVTLPGGSKVKSQPPDVSATSRFGEYSVATTRRGNEVTVTSHLAVTATRIAPADYAEWQRFCADVDRAFGPRLIIGS